MTKAKPLISGKTSLSAPLLEMRERGRKDFYYFATEILGYGRSPYSMVSACHRSMCDWLQATFDDPRMFHLWLAPRGHGKSRLGGSAHTLWRGVRNPDITIRYAHADEGMGSEIFNEMRSLLESNELFLTLYATGRDAPLYRDVRQMPLWSDDVFCFRRTFAPRTPSVKMLGYKTGSIGTHVDLFVIDDLVNPKTTTTPQVMEGVKDFIKRLPPLLNHPQRSKILIFGTRWDPMDAYGMLIDYKDGRVRTLIQSCYTDSEETTALWPEKYSVEVLRGMETEMTSVFFSACMRNEPILRGSQLFDVKNVQSYDLQLDAQGRPDLPFSEPYLIYTAVDPAGDAETSDNTCVMTVARDASGRHFVLDMEYGKPSSIEVIAWIRQAVQRWKPISVFYEYTAGQRLLIPWIKRDMIDSGVFYPLQKSTRPVNMSKEMRIRALANVIETKRLFVPRSVRFNPLLKDIELYTGKKHCRDDTLDCLADIYTDGYDANGGQKKSKKREEIEAPWQTSTLDAILGVQMGIHPKRVVSSERGVRIGFRR